MSSKKKNGRYYEILGVAETATLDDLKKAYKKAALKNHPDKGGDPGKFKEMVQAYENLLEDLKRREAYEEENPDETLRRKDSGGGRGGAADNGGGPRRRHSTSTTTDSDQSSARGNPSQERNKSEEENGSSGGGRGGGATDNGDRRHRPSTSTYSDQSSGSGNPSQERKKSEENGSSSTSASSASGSKKRGEDVIHHLKVSLEDLYLGTLKKLYVTRTVICSECDGRGSTLAGKQVTCLGCQGSGSKFRTIISRSGSSVESFSCKDCKGTGKVKSGADRCSQCKGAKVVREKKVKEVKVEKGMQAGERIILPGQADETPDTIPGDIVFVVQEKDHPVFRRRGDHLYVDHWVSPFEAICGFEFVLLHLDGRQVRIKSTPRRVFKFTSVSEMELDDEGMPIQATPWRKGKLHVCVNVKFPDSRPPEDPEFVEEFETMVESMNPEQLRLWTRMIPTFRE